MKKLLFNEFVIFLFSLIVLSIIFFTVEAYPEANRKEILKIDKRLPNAMLKNYGQPNVYLNDMKGKVKIISVVPQLNTPVCDEQTHQFSEKNGGIDRDIDIITISTNTAEGQHQFAEKAKIKNLYFLSDNPKFEFGKKTGLLIENMRVLRRTVMVVDKDNIIKYVDFVQGGGLPNIRRALKEAKKVFETSK